LIRLPWSRPALTLIVAASVSAALTAAGCGYSREGLYPANVSTVAVDGFTNHCFYQGVEIALTEALIKEIELRTPYKVTARSRADSVITGEILQIRQEPRSRRRTGGLVQDVEYRIVVSFEWKDIRSGKIIRQRVGMMVSAGFLPANEVGETLIRGQNQAVQRVSGRIVSIMKADM